MNIQLTIKDLENINKYFKDNDKLYILDQIKNKIKEEKIHMDIERLHKMLQENEKCSNIQRIGALLHGDFLYKYDNHKNVSIDIYNINKAEVRIDNYCYSTDSVEDIIKVLPDIHIAVEKGII